MLFTRFTRRAFALTALVASSSWLQAQGTLSSAKPFDDGDTVCFVGDSITHGGTYHSIVTLYYATRFPGKTIRFYNCGISGDRASSIMSDEKFRVNVDILGRKPTVATIMLGMNDVGRNDYAADKTGEEVEQKRKESLDTYSLNMTKLINALRTSGARLIFITPSIYEENIHLDLPKTADLMQGVNGALAQCAAKVRNLAADYRAGIVDFFQAMNSINERERKSADNFTIVGADRVHPGPVGHFAMAYTFLKSQGLPRDVSRIKLDGKKGKVKELGRVKVDKLHKKDGGLEFDAIEEALPLVVPENAQDALKLVPFTKDLNQEVINVLGLDDGQYTLKIDDAVVGEYSAADFYAGVNISANDKTPQYKQSALATEINTNRQKIGARMRDLAAQKYNMSRAGIDVSNAETVTTELNKRIEAAKTTNEASAKRIEGALKNHLSGDLEKQYEDLATQLAKACKTVKHHFVIAKK